MKIKIRSIAARLIALALLLVVFVPQAALAVTSQSLAVPVYDKPGGVFWNDVTNAGAATVPFVVASPNSGPGVAVDPAYKTAISKNAASNVRTLGYVQTNYQARSFKEAYGDIQTWYQLYPDTKGIFIDLVKEGGAPELCYVAALYSHVKNVRPNDIVVLSPGTHISAAYEPYGDMFLNASSDYGTYQNWRVQYPGFEDKPLYQNRFWHVVHGVSSSNYSSAFDAVRANNAGWTFITDKTSPAPFSTTPSYWQDEVGDVSNLPASSIPNRGKTPLPRGCISLSDSIDSTINTTVRKQSNTQSAITINNTSQSYDSEATTQLQVLSLPAGVSLTAISGEGWACTMSAKANCAYAATLPASSATKLSATFQAGCEFGSGDVVVRLFNYAGNQWDTKIPIRPPIGCDTSTAAGRVNTDATGQVLSLTTQSEETTPEITPLGGKESVPDVVAKTQDKGLSPGVIIAIIIAGVLFIGGIIAAVVVLYQRSRYKIDI
ncbi:MAG: spherulation-specific family 4 protein [Candidatus Saccharimonadales bacterium]